MLLVTYDCNLKCSYCYEPKSVSKSMSFDMAKNIIWETVCSLNSSYDAVHVEFMGGEPLLRFSMIKKVCEWIWTSEFPVPIEKVLIPTNGTLLDPAMKKWFSENRKRVGLSLSFDGDILMQNINRCSSASSIDLDFFVKNMSYGQVKMTLSPDTVGCFYAGLVFLYQRGFQNVQANLACGTHIHWEKSHLLTLRQELDKIVCYYVDHPSVKRMTMFDLPVWKVLERDEPLMECRAGNEMVCFDCDGTAYPCHLFAPITLPIQDSVRSRTIDFKTLSAKLHEPCGRCLLRKICVKCYGINFRDRGDCNMPSSFDCAQFKLFYFANCKLKQQIAHRNGDLKTEQMVEEITRLMLS